MKRSAEVSVAGFTADRARREANECLRMGGSRITIQKRAEALTGQITLQRCAKPWSCTNFQLLGTEFQSIYPKETEYNLEVTDLPLINTN